MSQKSKAFLLVIGISIVIALIIGVVAASFYRLGQEAVLAEIQIEQIGTDVRDLVEEQVVTDAPEPELSNDEIGETPGPTAETDEASGSAAGSIEETESNTAPESKSEPRRSIDISQSDLELFLEVWDIVDREFDGTIPTNKELTYGAIAGSLDLLNDQFTRFIPPELAERLREQIEGSFEGIGAFVDMTEDGYLIIVATIRGQPAELAGINDGDIVTHVDGESVLGKSVDEIVADVKGPKGTEVILTIIRESEEEPFDITVTRDVIELPIVEAVTLEDGLAYVRLANFTGNAAGQLEEVVTAQLANEPKALILDLRDNPGGFLSQSVAVADLFLPEGVVVYQRDRTGEETVFESDDGDIAEDIPLAVLIDAGSASASEIVAGAIQDRERGVLIGVSTFGKGSVQQPFTLSDGSEIRVTISRWYTPNNNSISKVGITPDIVVEISGMIDNNQDDQLQAAIDYLLSETSQ